jgi:hypothetical protein
MINVLVVLILENYGRFRKIVDTLENLGSKL